MKINTLLKVTIGTLATLLIISTISLFSLISDMDEQTEALKLDKEMAILATELQGASDYLTNEVRAYTQFGDKKHYDNYWTEVNETKTRDRVVARLQELHVPEELVELVALAQTNSNNLIKLEEQAMEAVAANDLTLARQLVYGPDYQAGKDIIAEPLQQFNDELAKWTAAKIIETEQAVNTKLTLFIILMGLVVVNLIVSFTLLTRKIKPLNKLTALAQQFATGNIRYEPFTVNGKDEIATLSSAFQTMAHQLREVLLTVNHASENLATSSQELLVNATQTSTVAQQVSSSFDQVAIDTSNQSRLVDESSAAMQDVLDGVHHIADSAAEIASSSEEATQRSQLGEQQIHKAIDQMKSIEDTVQQTAGAVEMLNTRSKEIEEIITTITAIADQTNLLALNAAIEAARAGEHGKGFAVVANEVKTLAEGSSQSAQRITAIIQSIQADTHTAVSQMTTVTKDVGEGVALIEQTGSSFTDILHSSENVSCKVQEMSAITAQIAAQTSQIVDAMTTINTLTTNTTDRTHTVTALSEEQLATTEEITSSIDSLSQLTLELNSELNKFKL